MTNAKDYVNYFHSLKRVKNAGIFNPYVINYVNKLDWN